MYHDVSRYIDTTRYTDTHVSHADVPTYCEDADEDAAIEAAALVALNVAQIMAVPVTPRLLLYFRRYPAHKSTGLLS